MRKYCEEDGSIAQEPSDSSYYKRSNVLKAEDRLLRDLEGHRGGQNEALGYGAKSSEDWEDGGNVSEEDGRYYHTSEEAKGDHNIRFAA